MQILEECGFLPAIGVVNIGAIPGGLSAEELERFLREDGAQICSPQPSTDGCLGQR
jgi:pseudouridine-5'-phosphate glycosidase